MKLRWKFNNHFHYYVYYFVYVHSVVNENVCVDADLVTLVETAQEEPALSNRSWLLAKEPSLLIREPLEKNGQESKFALRPLPSAVWPKHSDLAPILRHHGLHNKSKKALKSDRLQEHNGEKVWQAVGLLPKPPLPGPAASATATLSSSNRTVPKTNQDSQANISTPPHSEDNHQPSYRARDPAQPQPTPSPRKELLNRRLNPEENRPGKSSFDQAFVGADRRNHTRLPVTNRRSSSLLYQFELLRRGSSTLPQSQGGRSEPGDIPELVYYSNNP